MPTPLNFNTLNTPLPVCTRCGDIISERDAEDAGWSQNFTSPYQRQDEGLIKCKSCGFNSFFTRHIRVSYSTSAGQ